MGSALVLGGGGITGIAWETGVLTGLRRGGVDLTAADLVVGTSAGSVVGTLVAYFAAGASPRHAAHELHVHVNTVAQRLGRVAALLGDDWQHPDRALEIQLALRLRRLLSA